MKRLFESISRGRHDTSDFEEKFQVPIYKGTSAVGYIPYKERKAPRDTMFAAHNQINAESKSKIGHNIRNLTFCSMDYNDVYKYGTPKEIYAVGDDYKVYFHPDYRDLTVDLMVQVHDIEQILETAFRDVLIDTLSDPEKGDERIDDGTLSLSIVSHFNESKHKTYEDAMHAMVDDFTERLKDSISLSEDFADIVKDALKTDIEIFNDEVKKYVDGIKEATSDSDITNTRAELMIYAPQGFVLI